MTNTVRQYCAHDEPDDVGITRLARAAAMLIVIALSLLLWRVIWLAVAWAVESLL